MSPRGKVVHISNPPPKIIPSSEVTATSSVSNSLPSDYVFKSLPARKVPQRVRVDAQSPPKTSRRKDFRRAPHLQAAMDRLQQRRSNDAASLKAKGNDPQELRELLELFSTYDTILEHLVKKNKNLKTFVNGDTDEYPSGELSLTTVDILDTLDELRFQRHKTFERSEADSSSTHLGVDNKQGRSKSAGPRLRSGEDCYRSSRGKSHGPLPKSTLKSQSASGLRSSLRIVPREVNVQGRGQQKPKDLTWDSPGSEDSGSTFPSSYRSNSETGVERRSSRGSPKHLPPRFRHLNPSYQRQSNPVLPRDVLPYCPRGQFGDLNSAPRKSGGDPPARKSYGDDESLRLHRDLSVSTHGTADVPTQRLRGRYGESSTPSPQPCLFRKHSDIGSSSPGSEGGSELPVQKIRTPQKLVDIYRPETERLLDLYLPDTETGERVSSRRRVSPRGSQHEKERLASRYAKDVELRNSSTSSARLSLLLPQAERRNASQWEEVRNNVQEATDHRDERLSTRMLSRNTTRITPLDLRMSPPRRVTICKQVLSADSPTEETRGHFLPVSLSRKDPTVPLVTRNAFFPGENSQRSSVAPSEKARQLRFQVDEVYLYSQEVLASQERLRQDLSKIKDRNRERNDSMVLKARESFRGCMVDATDVDSQEDNPSELDYFPKDSFNIVESEDGIIHVEEEFLSLETQLSSGYHIADGVIHLDEDSAHSFIEDDLEDGKHIDDGVIHLDDASDQQSEYVCTGDDPGAHEPTEKLSTNKEAGPPDFDTYDENVDSGNDDVSIGRSDVSSYPDSDLEDKPAARQKARIYRLEIAEPEVIHPPRHNKIKDDNDDDNSVKDVPEDPEDVALVPAEKDTWDVGAGAFVQWGVDCVALPWGLTSF